jgi:hypothetical protein
MSVSLHPPAFTENAGGCEGPRYTRSQPSRETGGVLLNECAAKYSSNFKLPYRNVDRYINEVQQSWDKLTDKDKEAVSKNLIRNVPSLNSMNGSIGVGDESVTTFLKDYVSLDPKKNTMTVLDALYHHKSVKGVIDDDKLSGMKDGVKSWADSQHPLFHMNTTTVIIFCLFVAIFFFIGTAVGGRKMK